MFTKALVPLDGSELAEGILPFICQFGRGLSAPLVLLSVIDPHAVESGERSIDDEMPAGENFAGAHRAAVRPLRDPMEMAETAVRRNLEKVVKRLGSEGVVAEPLVALGKPAEEIVRAAERQQCDVVAMSTHGRSALANSILGSVTDNVIRSSRFPTLTVAPRMAERYWEEGDAISKVIVPLDGSSLAETALPYVEDLAKIIPLDVIVARVGVYSVYTRGEPSTRRADLEAEAEDDASEYLQRIVQDLRSKGLTAWSRVLRGDPGQSIVKLAQETPQNMVVLTTRGHSGLKRWVLGSVADAVVRSSGDPVLVIPPKDEA